MNPIRPELRELLVREAAVEEARLRQRRRRRRVAIPMAAFAVTVLVVALVLGGPARKVGPAVLGPQDAVAAVARAISDQDRVLSWTRQIVVETRTSAGAIRRQVAVETRRTDLRTGYSYVVTTSSSAAPNPGDPAKTESWSAAGRLWVATTDGAGRRVLREIPVLGASDPPYSTIADVRGILRRADRGELPVTDQRSGDLDVAVVTLRQRGDVSVQMSISRSGPPRVLQVRSRVGCQRRECAGRSTTQTSTTTAWTLAPRTAAELRRLTPPTNARPR